MPLSGKIRDAFAYVAIMDIVIYVAVSTLCTFFEMSPDGAMMDRIAIMATAAILGACIASYFARRTQNGRELHRLW
jgi:hypothetical protein